MSNPIAPSLLPNQNSPLAEYRALAEWHNPLSNSTFRNIVSELSLKSDCPANSNHTSDQIQAVLHRIDTIRSDLERISAEQGNLPDGAAVSTTCKPEDANIQLVALTTLGIVLKELKRFADHHVSANQSAPAGGGAAAHAQAPLPQDDLNADNDTPANQMTPEERSILLEYKQRHPHLHMLGQLCLLHSKLLQLKGLINLSKQKKFKGSEALHPIKTSQSAYMSPV